LVDFRPADANEVAVAWRAILNLHNTPAAMALSRQALPTFDRTKYASAEGVLKGGYVLADGDNPELLLIATGSEVQLCIGAYEELKKQGIRARVVSLPSWKLFQQQSEEYRNSVLPVAVRARVAVEAGTDLGWREYVGMDGEIIARSDFGASAPIKDLLKHFGFTVENVVAKSKEVLERVRQGGKK
jgi:transketolase